GRQWVRSGFWGGWMVGRGGVGAEPVVIEQGGGWWVLSEVDGVMQQYRCATQSQAKRFAEMLARQCPRPNPVSRPLPVSARAAAALPRVQVLKKSV
ncbi:MAG TPA: hypothetical protein VK420_08185, partial [Longimicrobium sp.]|nr:hypothetical protein [Longimicrobium sp.]